MCLYKQFRNFLARTLPDEEARTWPSWFLLCNVAGMGEKRQPWDRDATDEAVANGNICSGWEVVCPDGLVRHNRYHNLGDAESHARFASDPAWFAKRGCRLAPKPGRVERSLPLCCGGKHEARLVVLQHAVIEHGEA